MRAIIVGTLAVALPQGGQVITGNATITTPTPNTVQINQASDKAIINWKSFNIGSTEKTQFVQPSASSIALNRINPGQGASQIFGRLTANGRLILVNQAGIYFGPGSYVDVGGIIASTSNISNANFMAGKYIFNEPSTSGGSVINEGSIIARDNGLVALIGTGVSNSGFIQARLGNVVLASGNKFTIDFNGDQLINFTIDEAASQPGVDQNGNSLKSGVSNTGKIIANGGVILVAAKVATGVLDNVINMEGMAVAHSVSQHNGEIILSGGEQGTVKVSGHLNVSSRKHQGGTIKILGNNIQVTSSAVINANGKTGGGEILIGGNKHGAGSEQNADYTYIASGAKIYANAIFNGNGGNVVVWSNKGTQFYGDIFAQGGAQGGHGGFVEVSGKDYLNYAGSVNLLAPHGLTGTLLLDPEDLTIQTAGSTTATPSGSPTNTYTANLDNSILTVASLLSALGSANVLVQTTATPGSQAGNITVANSINWSNGNTLTLNAYGNIIGNASITNSGSGGLILLAGGSVSLPSITLGSNGNLSVTSGGNITETGILTIPGTSSFNANGNAITLTQNNIFTGAVSFYNTGSNPIVITNNAPLVLGTSSMGSGTLALTGTTGITQLGGVTSAGAASFILSGYGNINLNNSANNLSSSILFSGNLQDITLSNAATTTGSITLPASSFRNLTLQYTNAGVVVPATTIYGALSITAAGTISQSGALSINGTPTLTVTTAGSDILLGSYANTFNTQPVITSNGKIRTLALRFANNISFPTLPNGLTNLALTFDAEAIALPSITLPGTLTITSGGNITQSGALNIAGVTTLGVTAANSDILLNTATNTFSSSINIVNNTFLRDLSIRNNSASALAPTVPSTMRNLTLQFDNAGINFGSLAITGNLSAIVNGAITQSGALSINGSGATTTLSAGAANNINLTNSSNAFVNLGITSGKNVTLVTNNGINFVASTFGGNLDVTAGGDITQTGSISANNGAGSATFTTGTNNITLTTGGNAFGLLIIPTANNVSVSVINPLILGASTIGGSYNISASGSISQTGILTVTGTPTFAATTANSDILLGSYANDFMTTPVITNSGSLRNIALRNTAISAVMPTMPYSFTGLNIYFDNAGVVLPNMNLSGNLSVTAGGSITQNGIILVSGTPTLTVTAANSDILLNSYGNTFSKTPVITNNANLRDFALRNILANAAVPTLPMTLRNVTLQFDNAGIALPSLTVTGNLTATANGAITQTGALNVGSLATFTTANTSNVTLTNANNIFSTIGVTSASNASFVNGGALTLSTMNLSNSLNITTNGSLTQSGPLSISGAGSLILSVGSSNDITLNNASNTFLGLTTTTGRNVSVTDVNVNPLTLGASTISGTLTTSTAGSIAENGILTIAGTPTFTLTSGGTDILLSGYANSFSVTPIITDNGNVRDIALRNILASAVAPTLPTSTLRNLTIIFNNAAVNLSAATLSGALNVTSAGSITQSGVLNIGSTPTFTVTTANSDILLGSFANTFNVAPTITNNGNVRDLAYRNIYGGAYLPVLPNNLRNLSIEFDNTSLSIPTVTLKNGGSLSVITGGTLSQSGTLTVPGTSYFNAGSNMIDLTSNGANNNFSGAISLNNTGGSSVSLTNHAPTILGASSLGSGALTIISNGSISQTGAISQAAGAGTITLSSNAANSDVLLGTQTNNLSGNITFGGTLGNFRDIALRNTYVAAALPTNLTSLTALRNLTLQYDIASISLPALSLNSTGNLSVISGGNVATTGLIQTAGGNVNMSTTGAGTITIGSSGIKTSLNGVSSGGSVTLTAANTNNLNPVIIVNGIINTQGGTGGILSSGGAVQINQAPVVGAGNVALNGNSRSLILGDLTFTTATTFSINAADIIINGLITSTGIGSNLSFFADTGNTNQGGVRVTSTGAVNSSGNLTLSGSNLFVNPGVSIELQPGSWLQAAGTISLLGNVGNSNIIVNGNIQSTGVNQAVTTTAAGSGILQLGANITTNNGAINLNNATTLTSNASLSSNGGTINIPNILTSVGHTLTLSAGSGTDISLANANNQLGTVDIGSGNNVQLTTLNGLDLGASTISGDLNITANGNITQSGSLNLSGVGKTAIFSIGSNNNITLMNATNNFTNLAILSGNNVTLNDNNSLNLATSTLAGNLAITTAGAITQTGVLTVPGTASFNAGSNAITLSQSNLLTGAVSLTNAGNNNIALINATGLNLGASSVGSGTLSLTGLGVSQSGAITQAASGGAVTINAGAGIISLNNTSNYFTGSVSLNNTGNNNVSLTNSLGLVLGGSSIGSGALSLTSGGSISQTGALIQAANGGNITFNLTSPNSDVLLASQPNNFSGSIAYSGNLSNVRDVARRNINSDAAITTSVLSLLTNLRNVTYIFDNAGIVFSTPFALHNGGNLVVDTSGSLSGGTGGAITQTEGITVPGTASFNSGANAITLTQNNNFMGAVTLTNTGNNNVAVTNSSALSVGASSVGSGAFTLTGLGISQSGAITQAANALSFTVNAGAGIINLSNMNNILTAPISLNNAGNNNVALVNSVPLVLNTSIVGIGTLSLTSGGAITQIGAITQPSNAGAITVASTVAATNIDLSTAANNLSGAMTFSGTLGNIQDFKLRNVSSGALLPTNLSSLTNLRNLSLIFDNAGMIFPTLTLQSGGSLAVISSGDITQTGVLTVPGTANFDAGSNRIILTQNNNFTGNVTLNNTGNNDVAITNNGLLSLGSVTVGRGALALTGIGISQIGAITQAASAGDVTISAGAGIINLSNSSNSLVGNVLLSNSGANAIQLTNSGALSLGTSNVGSGTLGLTAGGSISEVGSVTQAVNAGIITLTFLTPSSDFLWASQPNNLSGFLNVGGTLDNLRDVSIRNIGTGNAAILNLQQLTSLRNVTVILDNVGLSVPALTLHNGGNLVLDTSGSLSGGTGGAITQTGVLTVPGTSSFSAGSNAITLTQDNNFAGNVTLTNSGNNNVAVTNNGLLTLAASNVGSGTLTLTSLGISQAGVIAQAVNAGAAIINAGAGAINLSNTGNVFTGPLSLYNSGANNVSLSNVSALILGASSIGTGTLTIGTTGAISETGGLTQAAGAGNVTINSNGNAMSLTQNNNFTGAVSLFNYGTNNVALTNNSALVLNTSSIGAGIFTVLSGGPITQIGTITQAASAGSASFNANSNAIALTQNNMFSGAVSLNNSGANNVALTNAMSLTLGTSFLGTGALNVIAAGPLTQTGAITQTIGAGAANFNVNANSIALTQANIFTGPVSLNNTGNNNVALTNNGLLTLGASTVGSGTMNLTSIGITQTGSLMQAVNAGAVNINAGSGVINLTNNSNYFTGSVLLNNSGSNNIALTNNAPLTLGTSLLGTGTLAITTNGTLSESGAITQSASAGTITLASNLASSDILLDTQANYLTGALSFGGNLNNIRDVALQNIFSSATLPTNLASLANLRNLTAIFYNTGITLPAITLSGNLTITAGNSILQNGALTVAGVPTFTVSTPSYIADILLASSANNFSITPVITSNGNVRDLALRNIAANAVVPTLPSGLRNLTLVFDNAGITLPSTTLSGNLVATANGAIGQSGALNVNNTGAITTLSAGVGNNISLTNASNLFSTVIINSGNNINLVDASSINLGTSIVSGSFTVNANGPISQSGGLSVIGSSSFTAGAANNITLTSASNDFSTVAIGSANNVSLTDINSLDLGVLNISGNLAVNTQGAVTQSGALTINGAGKTTTISANAGDITLTNVNNAFTNFAVTSGNNVSVTDSNAINLAASTISGNFNLTTSGAITQNSALIMNGIGKIVTLNAGNAGDINLNAVLNNLGTIAITNARAVSLQNANDLTLASVISQSFAATVGGNLTTSGLIKTAGGNVNLATTGAGTITIGASGIDTSTNQISSGGSISITAANTGALTTPITINGVLDTRGGSGGILTLGGGTELNQTPILGAGNINLDGSSHSQFFGNLAFTTAQTIAISNADLIINGPISSTGIGSNLTFISDVLNNGLGGIRVTSTGSVDSSGTLSLSASNLYVNPGTSIELQPGSSLIAAGAISLLGNVGNSNILVNGTIQATGANQAITITPAGVGAIQLGANLSTNAGGINLTNNTQLINNVTLTTNGGTITAGQINGVGETLTLGLGSGTDLSLTNANNDIGTIAITSGHNIQLVNLNNIDLGASTISGNLNVSSGANITNSGALQVAGTSTFLSSGNGDITLNQLANNFNTVAITNAGNVSLQDINAIDLGPINILGNLNVVANGAITQNTGSIILNGANATATFAAGMSNDISLNNATNNFKTVAITNANNVILQNSTALNLGTVNLAGNLNITTNGDITQSGILNMNNSNKTATFAAGISHDINLNNSANNFDNVLIASGNNVTLQNANAINFNTSTVSGNLAVSAIGAITETGPLTVVGTSSFSANSAPINLTQNNQFTGSVLLSNAGNNNVAVTNIGLLTIGPMTSSLGSGTLTLTSTGVVQSGAITQAANAGAVTINAGAGVINFGESGNRFTGPVLLNNSGVNDVLLTNSIALSIGASNVGAGALALTAGGSISETGAIVQAANAGTVTLSVTSPLSDILLASQPNNFTGAVVYGGTLSNIRDIGRRNIEINAGLTPTNIDLLVNLRNLTLILDNASIYAPAFTLHNGGSLYVDTSGALSGGTGGSIIQTGLATIPGTVTLIAGNHSIIADQNNNVGGEVFLSNSGNNNVIFTNNAALNIGSANVGSGTLTLTGIGVSQTGAITQEANAGNVLVNAGAGAINLVNSGNLLTGAVSLNNSGINNVGLTNSAALVLGASNIGSGASSFTAGDTISETGALIQAANAGALTLSVTAPLSDILFSSQPNDINGGVFFGGDLSNIRDLASRNVNSNPGTVGTDLALLINLRNVTVILDNANFYTKAVTLHNGGNLLVDTSGSLSGGTGGNIIQLGAVTVPGTMTLNAGTHTILANQNNNVTGDVFLTNSGNNNVTFTNTGELHIGASSVGSGILTLNGLGISEDGAITQEANAVSTVINAGAAAINLTNAGNNFTGPVSLFNSGINNVTLVNANALALGVSTVGTGTLSLTSGGAITQTGAITQPSNAGAITVASTVAATNIDLSTAANNLSGAVSFSGVLGNIQDFKLRNVSSGALLPTNLTSLTNLRNLSLIFDNAGIAFPALTLQSGGSLAVISGGNITQTGILTVPGTANFDAGSNRIILTQDNNFTGNVTLSNSGNNDVAITNNGLLSLGSVSVGSGALTLTGIGISQTGAITQAAAAGDVTINAGAGMINLGNSSNSFTGAIALNNSGANDIQFTNTLPIVLRASNIGSGALGLTAGGNISQTGALVQAANAGISTYTFTSSNSDLLLGTQPNIFTGDFNIGGDLGNLRDISVWNAGTGNTPVINLLLLTNLRNLTLTFDNVGLSFPALTLHNGGNLTVNTSGSGSGGVGGQITETGILTIPGTAYFNAGSNAITLTQNNNFSGNVTLINAGNNNVAVTNNDLLTLAASNVGSGTLTLTGLGISQVGGITQAASAGTAIFNAGAAAINLSNASNNFTGPVSLYNSGNNNVILINNGNLALNTSTVGSGTLSLTAGGTLSEEGGITQAANAGAITLINSDGSSNMLFDQANNLNGLLSFGGNVDFIHNVSLRNVNAGATLPTNLSALSALTNLTIVFDNASIILPALTLHSGGNLNVDASGILSGGTGGSITQAGAISVPGSASFSAGANAIDLTTNGSSNIFNGAVTLSNIGANDVSLTTSGALQLATSSIGRNLTSIAGGTITLNGQITSGNSIVLSGSSFVNNAGSSVLNPGTGNFLVWSANPANDYRGGIVYNFKQYNAIYGVTPVQGTGNGFLYTIAPIITPLLVGDLSKSYTGTTDATLSPSNYASSGNIDGDIITLNNPASGTYASSDVGTNINISVSGISIISATNGSAIVYGYQIIPTANAAGQITPASLTITANDISKTYGQTVTFTGSEFTPTGLQNSETIGSVNLTSAGAISTANVGSSPYSIVASLATGGTFNPANYSISYTDGALTVNPASLTVAANNASKTYGQTVTFSGGEFTPTGLQNNETIGSVSLASAGAINTANVGSSPYSIVASLATGGTFNPANYSISYTDGALTVNPASLTVAANNANKTYGQTVTFSGSEFTPTGLQNNETIGSVNLTSAGAINTA
ncbi:MAG: MBG domain-containing protein, partial [Gammaproteobacteria bacterium]|nr:MBG domain-containing protein [Gammaproteobacteria bacterium]